MNPRITSPTLAEQVQAEREHAITAVCMRCAAPATIIIWNGRYEFDSFSVTCYNMGHHIEDYTLNMQYHQTNY